MTLSLVSFDQSPSLFSRTPSISTGLGIPVLEKGVHEADHLVFAILGHHDTAGVTTLALDNFKSPNLLYTLATEA